MDSSIKRIEWVDALKGFGIFCVTLGHLSCNYLLETHIYSFHMFLFFFISGFLHNNSQGDFKKYMAKKTKALLIPFLLWNFLSCLAGAVLFKNTITESVRLFFFLDGEVCWNAPIWFLQQLFMVSVVFFFIEKYIPQGKYLSIPVLFVLWMLVSGNNIFLKLNILPVCLLFYTLGNIFRHFYDKHGENTSVNKLHIISAAVLILFANILFGIVLNKRISFTGADFGNIIYCSISAVSGIAFYFIVFRYIRFLGTNKVLSYLGKNSLIIMATQYWFFRLYDIVSNRLFSIGIWHYRSTVKAFVISVITILLICAIIEVMKKIGAKSRGLKNLCSWFGVNMPKVKE